MTPDPGRRQQAPRGVPREAVQQLLRRRLGRPGASGRVVGDDVDVAHGGILYVDDITVSFDGFRALNKLTLNIAVGELRCIIGPNGAGKTTMMDVITGKTKPDSGRARSSGRTSTCCVCARARSRAAASAASSRSPRCSSSCRCSKTSNSRSRWTAACARRCCTG